MGGHGGLNILPQKRWNVYGRENRLKVARDEAKFEEEERGTREKHVEAERAYRHQLLLRRARGGGEAADSSADAPASVVSLLAALDPQPPAEPAALLEPSGPAAHAEARPAKHINFFEEQEARELHPEVKAERKDEQRRRGNPDTQTSDAKFDERFKLGYGLTEPANQPWYSKAGSTLPVEDDRGQDDAEHELLLNAPLAPEPHALAAVRIYDPKKHKKSRHKDKKHKRDKGAPGGPAKGKVKKKSLEELRAERREREAAEARRQRNVMLGKAADTLNDGVDKSKKRYHSSFGFAPDKRHRL